jgi:uncharacterized protein (TIGR02001 family)
VAPQRRRRERFLRLAAAVAFATLAASARAQVSGSLGIDSDYRYRGVSLSRSEPSVRATVNYDAPERWYAGALATRAALTPSDTYTQLSGYAGWTTARAEGRSFEIGVDGSHFAGASHYDFGEAYVGVLADRWSARLSYSPDYYGQSARVAYLESNLYPPLDRNMRLFAHLGALVPLAGASGDAAKTRFDASVGAGVALGQWDLHIAATGATPSGPYPAVYSGRRAALVIGAAISF